MPELVILDASQPAELRDFERREVFGRIVPYGETIRYHGRDESFALGALAGVTTRPASVRLFDHHQRVVGRATSIEEREDGAYGTFRVAKTAAGDDLLELAREGLVGFSLGFLPGAQTRGGVHTRIESLPEVSLVSLPAYPSAKVLSVREKETPMDPTTTDPATETTVTPDPAPTVDLAPLEQRTADLESTMERLQADLSAPDPTARSVRSIFPHTPLDWFVAQTRALFDDFSRRDRIAEDWATLQTRAANGELQTRALDDITGGQTQAGDNSPADDLSGLVVEEFMASQLVNVLDTRRPIFANLGRFPMPRSGYAKIPTVTQHTEVSARGTQKTEVPSQKMITTNAEFSAAWLAGAVDIALEVIRTADLDVLALVWNDLLGQYARATEYDSTSGAVPLIEAGGHGFTYDGTALATNTYEAFIADVLAGADSVEDASGAPATLLFVTRAQFRAIAGFVDANDRRIFSVLNPQNADASAGLNAKAIALPGGPTVIKAGSADLTQAFLTNEESLKVSDSGPERVQAINVALMGQDVGVLGRTMFIPRIPAGVYVFGTDPESS